MNLLPRSLFSRLVLVLLAGLTVAQLVSFAIHSQERGELLLRASGAQSAQRIADIVRLLESSDASGRRQIAQVLAEPPLVVSLDRAALPAAPPPGSRTALFGTVIRRALGDGWAVEAVAIDDAATWAAPLHGPGAFGPGAVRGGSGGPHGAMHAQAAQRGLSFVAQVRLHDGTLVTFDARQPEQAIGWPYRLLASLAVLLTAVIAVSLVAVRWVTRPLKVLADAADELGRHIHRPPMAESGPIEVVRAAHAFNAMQARLVVYLRERTSVLAAMSHDLKTPVTRLRLRAEMLPDAQQRRKFTQDLEEMEAMVAATLDYLRGAYGAEDAQPIDVGALLESLQADVIETGGRMTLTGRALQPYPAQPTALKRCVRNLVENAVKYGDVAAVEVQDDPAALRITVRDEGPGLPPHELQRVFEPFYRVDASRSRDTGGTGLGLTIARSIAEMHGGSLTLRNRPQGGLEAQLVLPRTPT
ncbi:ATP-binding protein [Hydrogenophaga sp. BPS33]|uniref:ATP-binding protein n=1 Tax=Hydrogenophaga sp. BPS33 TaxID=2651974 RepID=UPI00131F6CB8|nr:ATP-binding protein [Hydrogenophaga sp. BPS33]QHE86211.1 HAMP domain-containing protein [Hydrogenophaga sp. BPS33]